MYNKKFFSLKKMLTKYIEQLKGMSSFKKIWHCLIVEGVRKKIPPSILSKSLELKEYFFPDTLYNTQ